ncbi:hypothetical protein scyTo_0020543, partial [Scyliorhinus torazame]|nr:hypothetical protein [Scyliorhinus torazame]
MTTQQRYQMKIGVLTAFFANCIEIWKIHHPMDNLTVLVLAVVLLMTLLRWRRKIFLTFPIPGNFNQKIPFAEQGPQKR